MTRPQSAANAWALFLWALPKGERPMGIESNRTQIEPDAGMDEVAAPADGATTEVNNAAPAKDKALNAAEPTDGGDGTGEPGQEDSAAGAADGETETEEINEGEIEGSLGPVAQQLEQLNKRIDDLASGKVGNTEAEPDLTKDVLLPEFTEPVLAQFQDQFDVTPKQANLMRGLVNEVAQRILKQVQGTTAGYRRDQALAGMASEKDAAGKTKYPGINTPQIKVGMDEFMKDYTPGIHARKDLLHRAYFYARGQMRDVDLAKLRKGKEVSRTIAGKTKMAAAGGAGAAEKAVVLNSSQKLAAKYHPGGEKGYIADLRRGGGARRSRIEAAA